MGTRSTIVAGLLIASAGTCGAGSFKPPEAQQSRLTLVALGSYEYDSNVLQLPETGGDIPTDKADTSYLAFLFANYRGILSERTQWRAFAFWKDYRKLNSLDMLGLSMGVKQGMPVPVGDVYWRYDAQYFQLDRKSYLLLHTAGVDYDILKGRPEKLLLGYRASYRDFVPAGYEGLEGFQHLASLQASRAFDSWFKSVKLKAEPYLERPRDPRFKHRGVQGLVEATLSLPGQCELTLTPSVHWRRYDVPDASDVRRQELSRQYLASLSRALADWLSVEFSYSYGNNTSNLPSLEYKKTVASVTLSVSI